MAELAPFAGFGPDAMSFLDGLAADNSKAYFDANRKVYDTQIAMPMKQLVLAVGERLAGSVAPDVEFEPKVGKSLFRINRDLRFSKDPTPYNTHLDAAWWQGDHVKVSPAFIMRITSDSVLTGVGVYGLDGDRLARYRAAVVGGPGEELADVVGRLARSVKGAALSEPTRKRVPSGIDPDHPRAEFLLRDGFHMSATAPTPASITSARFAPWVADRLARFVELQRWLVANT